MMKSSAQNTRAGFGDRFIAFANKVSDVSGLVAAYLLVPLVIVFLIEIVSRNVFNHPTTWASGTCFLIGGCAAVLSTGSWNAPIWPTKIVMSISLIILTLQGLAEIIQLVQRLRAAKREGEQ